MRAITVLPGKPGSAELTEVPEPPEEDGPVLVETLAVGVCGTDIEIVDGEYGTAPAGDERLVLGHESLGRVLEAPAGSGLTEGDLVVGIVRRPDTVPCPNCAVGEWDMCTNERYTERGIKARHGYMSERFRIRPDFAVPVDAHLDRTGVLLEPTSVVAKAWEHTEAIGRRARWEPRRVLVTGAGPIGLLAALLARQRELEVTLYNRSSGGVKEALASDLGAGFRTDGLEALVAESDVVIETTGAAAVVAACLANTAPGSITCLLGVSPAGNETALDLGHVNREVVLGNAVVFGSVNANRRHYEAAAAALSAADQSWLDRVITRRVPYPSFPEALDRRPDDVKVVLEFAT